MQQQSCQLLQLQCCRVAWCHGFMWHIATACRALLHLYRDLEINPTKRIQSICIHLPLPVSVQTREDVARLATAIGQSSSWLSIRLDNAIKVNNISLHRSASLVFTLQASDSPWHTGMWDHVSSLNDICCGGDRGQKFKNNQNKLIPAQTI